MENIEPIMEFIKNQLVKDQMEKNIKEEDDLITSGIIDSIGILKLIAFLESRFSINISDEELIPENFQSIKEINSFISNKNGLTGKFANGPGCK